MSRCKIVPPVDNGTRPAPLACCRVSGHDGDCHRHFSGIIPPGMPAHTVVMRGSWAGATVACADGMALDGVTP